MKAGVKASTKYGLRPCSLQTLAVQPYRVDWLAPSPHLAPTVSSVATGLRNGISVAQPHADLFDRLIPLRLAQSC